MRKLPMLVIAALAMALSALPAVAITNGVPDTDERYPFVGLTVLQVGDEIGVQCSGTLIAPTVFVTAGHCTYNAIHRWQATNV
jgi:V8-like Glu-specific endopeptidase